MAYTALGMFVPLVLAILVYIGYVWVGIANGNARTTGTIAGLGLRAPVTRDSRCARRSAHSRRIGARRCLRARLRYRRRPAFPDRHHAALRARHALRNAGLGDDASRSRRAHHRSQEHRRQRVRASLGRRPRHAASVCRRRERRSGARIAAARIPRCCSFTLRRGSRRIRSPWVLRSSSTSPIRGTTSWRATRSNAKSARARWRHFSR